MLKYLFDGSFEGLLTAIHEAYYRHERPVQILPDRNLQEDILSSNIHITTDFEKADRVYNSIRQKISVNALQNVYYTYLSETEGLGMLIYEYLRLGWKVGKKVDSYLSDDRILPVHNISKKVTFEKHRMQGLIRFRKLGREMYYASIEPDYNITALLSPHFANRFADQDWIIHDLKRNLASIYNRKEWIITDLERTALEGIETNDDFCQGLWKQYYKNIAIQERINPRLQKQYMPVRYWRHLTEKQL